MLENPETGSRQCLLKNGCCKPSIAFYNLETAIRHKNRMKAEALRCRNVAGMLFNFIGNTVIHSCVKVELSYEIKNAPRGCAARGKENIALRTARARRISQARFSARERFAKRYFPYRELRILAERFLFHRKVPLSHMNVSRYFL